MDTIRLLDNDTIDQIAAGEVVERPSSVVKELVENAIDAGATKLTVQIRDGGIGLIRVTDNGSGIPADQVRSAFLRHATSKIGSAEDLAHLHSLGFRGEALSSIAAVAQVELVTKTADSLSATRICVHGGVEVECEEIGAPDGTTVLVRNLFYHTPARRKFLKSPATEAGYVAELMEHLALGNPDISIQFSQNGRIHFASSGNGDLREIIYRIYGRQVAEEMTPFSRQENGLSLFGYLGKPSLSRSNRNYETYFINGRYVRDILLAKAIEEGYRAYLMQHRFPFAVLHLAMDPSRYDVNVHPSKMEVRFENQREIFDLVSSMVREALASREMIQEVTFSDKKRGDNPLSAGKERQAPFAYPQDFPARRDDHNASLRIGEELPTGFFNLDALPDEIVASGDPALPKTDTDGSLSMRIQGEQQLELSREKLLSSANRPEYHILGQVFDTYWLVAYKDSLLIVDQHAAHEKVKYERLVKSLERGSVASQSLDPPIILSLSGREEQLLAQYLEYFASLGFLVEEFGDHAIALRSVPVELYGYGEKRLFMEILDELALDTPSERPEAVCGKLASMACKAAVKGSSRMSAPEMEALLDELLLLDNPYHCPHGRPTMIVMTKSELERRFKRV